MLEFFFLLHVLSTLAMVGVIWFVQVVHYPLFKQVGVERFSEYENAHRRLTSIVVAPLMVIEAITAVVLLWLGPVAIPFSAAALGVALIGALWASTFFWQVPAHEKLSRAFDSLTHRRLVRSNWLRTGLWSARGALICWMVFQLVTANGPSVFATLQGVR